MQGKPSWRNGSASLSYEIHRRRLRVRSSSAVHFCSVQSSVGWDSSGKEIKGLSCLRRSRFYADIVFEQWSPFFTNMRQNTLV